MNNHFQSVILKATHAQGLFLIETIQRLWAGTKGLFAMA